MADNPMKLKGFTVIELVVAIAIASILLSLAAPSFTTSIQNNRLVTQINELNTSLSIARTEAIKRNSNITVCKSSNGTSCSGNWHDGRIIFIDNDSDGSVDNGDGDEILFVSGAIPADSTLTFSETRVSYANTGFGTSGANGAFTLCDTRGATHAKGLIIGPTGRPRLAMDSDENGILEDNSDTDLEC